MVEDQRDCVDLTLDVSVVLCVDGPTPLYVHDGLKAALPSGASRTCIRALPVSLRR